MTGARVASGATATGRLAVLATAVALGIGTALLPGTASSASPSVTAPADAVPSTVSVAMPGPGHSSAWSGSIANPGSDATAAYLTVTAVGGSAAAFGDLLTATVSLPSGGAIIAETPVADLVAGPPVNLGPIPAGATVTFGGAVSLSRAAGDEFQGLGATIVFQLTSVEKALPPPAITLPDTGSTIAIAGIAVAVVAILGGLILLVGRRKRKRENT